MAAEVSFARVVLLRVGLGKLAEADRIQPQLASIRIRLAGVVERTFERHAAAEDRRLDVKIHITALRAHRRGHAGERKTLAEDLIREKPGRHVHSIVLHLRREVRLPHSSQRSLV